jgi:hypothetical protein
VINRYSIPCRDLNTHEAFPVVVCQLADGGYAVTGTTVSAHPADLFVFRTNAAGALVWAKSYDHDPSFWRFSTGQDIHENGNGDLIIAGSMDKDALMQPNCPYVLRVTGAGALVDAAFYETVPSLMFQSGFSSVAPLAGGGFFFTGMGGYSSFGDQAQLLKTDADLNMIWSRVYTMDGLATMGSRSGRPTSDGGYVFTGKRQFTGTVLMKTDAVGLISCKNPNLLVENLPGLVVQNKLPSVASMAMGANVVLTEAMLVSDTTMICPTTFSVMPVELVSFTVAALPNGQALTAWTTATERDNDHFEIEKSGDAINFQWAGSIAGAGSSAEELHYEFVDEDPLPAPVSYYRLKQVDIDGTTTYSAAIAVTFRGDMLQLVGANADHAGGDIVIQLIAPSDQQLAYKLMDPAGRIVRAGTFAASRGTNVLRIPARDLSSGIYPIVITGASEVTGGKLAY